MSEVINAYIGGCGIKIHDQYWRRLCTEHGLETSTGKLNVDYYTH